MQTRPAIVHLELVELGADGRGRTIDGRPQQREKGAVAAAVVEDALSAKAPRELHTDVEPPPMTPGDEPILAEDLLRGVMPFTNRGIYGRFCRQNFLSRASHVPRIVIQNESRIRQMSTRSDRRRMYKRSKRNFWRLDTSRGA